MAYFRLCYDLGMTIFKIDSIEAQLQDYEAETLEVTQSTRQAAVATILREYEGHTQALFILRATQEGDPWSGHMAFPGGHKEPQDADLQETARRETLEEIGLDLGESGRLLGSLDSVKVNPRGRNIELVVTPYVYVLEKEAKFTLNYEVADVLWGSLNHMYTGDSLTEKDFQIAGQWQSFKGYGVGEQLVWGLTYRMLDHLFNILDPSWESTSY